MGIVLIWAIGVVLVLAVATTFYRSYRNSRVPPPHARHPPRRKRPKRPKRHHR
jgi:hypothetical protein